MKQKEYLSEVEKKRQRRKAVWILFLIIISITASLSILNSCSAPQQGYQTTPPNPKLFVPDVSVRMITGVTKNGKAYTCVDGKGRKAQNITPWDGIINTEMIGTWSDVRDEFSYR